MHKAFIDTMKRVKEQTLVNTKLSTPGDLKEFYLN